MLFLFPVLPADFRPFFPFPLAVLTAAAPHNVSEECRKVLRHLVVQEKEGGNVFRPWKTAALMYAERRCGSQSLEKSEQLS